MATQAIDTDAHMHDNGVSAFERRLGDARETYVTELTKCLEVGQQCIM